MIKLQAQLGEVRFEISPANALVRVDGKPRGRGNQTLSLPAFEHSVEIVLDGHATAHLDAEYSNHSDSPYLSDYP